MCTTIGFKYNEGVVFGRTLELGMKLNHKILFVPKGNNEITKGIEKTTYNTLGTGFEGFLAFGDGINEEGLMASFNFFPMENAFSELPVEGKLNMIADTAFNLLLTTCKDVEEVRTKANTINILAHDPETKQPSSTNHFMFMDKHGKSIVLEPSGSSFKIFDNPYGVLTNAPEFDYHIKNLSNYVNLKPYAPDSDIKPYGLGSGMLGLPGDFTPASRFVRAWYFVHNTDKHMNSREALMQAFRILNQFDIPKGAVIDTSNNHNDETLYTATMDSKKLTYHLKCQENTNIQSFSLNDFGDKVVWINLIKEIIDEDDSNIY